MDLGSNKTGPSQIEIFIKKKGVRRDISNQASVLDEPALRESSPQRIVPDIVPAEMALHHYYIISSFQNGAVACD